ncbi:MAG: putative beta-lysine N-acetyltransferase [Fibrobacter sp.]|jgi:putative beta-lysine N-acetyltransferase|nr:putative beta-lysine N-acetyltransferase [Fibrobacter sp.]
MSCDCIEKKDGALFQHGKASDRLYLMKWDRNEPKRLLQTIYRLITANGYTKAFIKVPEHHASFFAQNGFEEEARIPAYYDLNACIFMGKFFHPDRKKVLPQIQETMDRNLALALDKKREKSTPALPQGFCLRELISGDCQQLASLYRNVFLTYPFPIFDPAYLEQTMKENIAYFGIFSGKTLVAASSAEMDLETSSVEFTDFGTNPDFRGNSFAAILLAKMEKSMTVRGIKTRYTIARALSASMNITFAKAGYHYCGTLTNNTGISGSIESMNVWYA